MYTERMNALIHLGVGLHLFHYCQANNDTNTEHNIIVAWSIAGVGILMAIVFLSLFLCVKLRETMCCGCYKCVKTPFHLNGVDIASIYRQTSAVRDSEHSYARIEDVKTIEDEIDNQSNSCQNRVPTKNNSQQSPGEEYLFPRVSTENVTDDDRISRLSGLLGSPFWSQASMEDNDELVNAHHSQRNRGRPRCCRQQSRNYERKWRLIKRGHQPKAQAFNGYATAGHFIPEVDDNCEDYHVDDGRSYTKHPTATDSMVDVFQELLNPANKTFRNDLLRQLRMNSTLDDHRSRRMSRSCTDLSLAQDFEKYGEDNELGHDEDYYAAIADVKRPTPTPKRRKSLSRKQNLRYASETDGTASDTGEVNARASVKSNTIQCTYQAWQEEKLKPPVPLPRSKSLTRDQIPATGILKKSEVRCLMRDDDACEDTSVRETLISEFSLPQRNLRESMYRNQVTGGNSSLNQTAQKVKKATYLDGRAVPTKEYLNVRMVVKNLSCSAEDIGFDSDFWNS